VVSNRGSVLFSMFLLLTATLDYGCQHPGTPSTFQGSDPALYEGIRSTETGGSGVYLSRPYPDYRMINAAVDSQKWRRLKEVAPQIAEIDAEQAAMLRGPVLPFIVLEQVTLNSKNYIFALRFSPEGPECLSGVLIEAPATAKSRWKYCNVFPSAGSDSNQPELVSKLLGRSRCNYIKLSAGKRCGTSCEFCFAVNLDSTPALAHVELLPAGTDVQLVVSVRPAAPI